MTGSAGREIDIMKYENKRVLILGGAVRQLLPLAKGFYDLGCIVTTLCQRISEAREDEC